MKKNLLLFISCLGVSAQIQAMTLVPITNDTKATDSGISYSIKNSSDNISNTFLSSEPVKLQFDIIVKAEDVGQSGQLYLVAKYQGNWYQKKPSGQWQPWDQKVSSLSAFSRKVLKKQETITVLDRELMAAGEYLVYAGYQSNSKQIFYNKTSASMLVFDKDNAALHPVKSSPLFASYFAHGTLQNKRFVTDDFSPLIINTSADTGASIENTSSYSQTNLQETGVDEADRVKTDGKNLYVVEDCENELNRQCLTSYAIQANPATNTKLAQLGVGNHSGQKGAIYLSQFNGKKHIIYHSNAYQYGIFGIWHFPAFWQNNQVNIKIIDVSQPQNMQVSTHITMDTSVVSSRLIDGVLYLMTRKNAFFDRAVPLPVIDPVTTGIQVTTTPGEQQTKPVNNPVVPEDQTIDDLLPTILFNDGSDAEPVVKATDCFIPNQASSKQVDNTIITITAIPLDNPKTHYSTCVAGAVDTFYMSTQSMYLATNRYPYSVMGNNIRFPGSAESEQIERTTEIHKFALNKGTLDYRGSGVVPGHLGWDANKQPFRMGEYNDILKVATSQGNTWDDSSTTRVSVLRESSDDNTLEEIGFIDNLGKPGERLFAARFINNRGYLVTFKQTDPLYVLDFTEPEQPVMLGELEIDGYSDYLHPIGDDYLLGIGKDAIPAENPEAGALYQGVKLSLFDVSSGENLGELDSVILGKRGTESAVLYDHHALAWLPSEQGDSALLAIPVQLNTLKGNNHQDYSHPGAYYDWTHTGLYTFKVSTADTPRIELQGKLISDIPPEQCNKPGNYCSFRGQHTMNDRAVILQDSIHYIHNNAVLSSAIDDLE